MIANTNGKGGMMMTSKIKAMIIGHAVADALGVPVEFESRSRLWADPVVSMRGYGNYDVPAGAWSDDTSMTLALLDSIARCGAIDYDDIMNGFLRWVDEAEYTPTGKAFDIGRGTRKAIMRYHHGTPALECGGLGEGDNGNGSLMRIAPLVPYLYARHGLELTADDLAFVHSVSQLTHAHARSKIACGIYVLIGVRVLSGQDIGAAVSDGLAVAREFYSGQSEFAAEFAHYARLFAPDFARLPVSEIKSSGYVVDSIEAALWCLLNTHSYSECVLGAVNLGEDTDTIGAIAGGLAGLHYGLDAIPEPWRETLLRSDYIEKLCVDFATTLK